MAKKTLDELLAKRNDIVLEEIEIISNPLRTLRDGVKFIPTLKSGQIQVSGILLSNKKIETFIKKVENS